MAAVLALAALMAAACVLVMTPDAGSTPTKCESGEAKDAFTGVCFPVAPTDVIEETTPDFGGPPEIDGFPCTGHNSYECIGLAEESQADGPPPTPHATVEHSP